VPESPERAGNLGVQPVRRLDVLHLQFCQVRRIISLPELRVVGGNRGDGNPRKHRRRSDAWNRLSQTPAGGGNSPVRDLPCANVFDMRFWLSRRYPSMSDLCDRPAKDVR